jgi:FKBP-type peptidyl-prolyl cis-trans isomerase SlpA
MTDKQQKENAELNEEVQLDAETEAKVDAIVDQMMAQMPKLVEPDSTIEVRYKLTLMDGTLVDETEGDETFTFKLGEGHMLNKLEELLIGLEIGTTGTFIIPPEEGFGEVDPANFHEVPRSEFPEEMGVKPNMVVGFEGPDGQEIPGWIKQVEDETVVVDFNHPLAGQTIQFEAEIVDIKD